MPKKKLPCDCGKSFHASAIAAHQLKCPAWRANLSKVAREVAEGSKGDNPPMDAVLGACLGAFSLFVKDRDTRAVAREASHEFLMATAMRKIKDVAGTGKQPTASPGESFNVRITSVDRIAGRNAFVVWLRQDDDLATVLKTIENTGTRRFVARQNSGRWRVDTVKRAVGRVGLVLESMLLDGDTIIPVPRVTTPLAVRAEK